MKKFIVGFLATIGGISLFSLVALLVIAKSTQSKTYTIQQNTVLTIDLTGTMHEYNGTKSLYGWVGPKGDSLYYLVQTIDQASKDPRVKGIVMRIDRASMGLAQAQELRNAIMRFRVLGRDQNKFTIAHADTYGEFSSGTTAFYLASAFDEIWVQPMGEVAINGLFIESPYGKELLDSLGIKARIGKREEYKSAFDGLIDDSMNKPTREELQSLLNSMMNQVVRDIALGRELNEADVWDAVNKSPLQGGEALKAGIIDRNDYYDEITSYVNNKLPGATFMKASNYIASNPLPAVEKGKSKIALVFASGSIVRQAGAYSELMNESMIVGDDVRVAIEKASEDPDVAAIVFRVNSPGGSHIASETILRALRKAQQAGKPVIISMSNLAASGGYWISTFADKIVAHPSTITGSIGVLSGKLVLKDAWKKIGVNWEGIKIGENADIMSSNEDFSTTGWEKMQATLDHIYNGFIERVSEGRKLPKEHVLQIAKGRVWSGEDALKFGLVDKLGDLKEAIDLAKEAISMKDQTVAIEVFPKPLGLSDQIQMLFGGDTEASAVDLGPITPVLQSLAVISSLYNQVSSYLTPSGAVAAAELNIKG